MCDGRWRRKEERVVWLLGPVSRVDGGGKDPDPVMARVGGVRGQQNHGCSRPGGR